MTQDEWKTKVAARFAHLYDPSVPPPAPTADLLAEPEPSLSTAAFFEAPDLALASA